MSERVMKALANCEQELSEGQQLQARTNIGAIAGVKVTNAGGTQTLVPDADGYVEVDLSNAGRIQSDWQETNPAEPSYIRNKPDMKPLVAGEGISIVPANDHVTISNTAYQLTPVVQGTTTLAELQDMLAAGKHPVLVDSDGTVFGKFKYATESFAIFESFFVQPMRFMEYRLDASGWETYTYYVTDTATPKVYTIGRTGVEYKQSTLPKMDFDITSYLAQTVSRKWMTGGEPISGSMFDEFVREKPQFVRFDYSSDLAYVLDAAPAGAPTAILTVELILSYTATQASPYTDVVQDWAPKLVIPFSNFASDGQGAYISCEKPLSYSVTFDRERFENLFAGLYDAHFWLRGTISNITLPGTIHSLRQVAAHSQYTFMNHV